jgi:hypothetical protein
VVWDLTAGRDLADPRAEVPWRGEADLRPYATGPVCTRSLSMMAATENMAFQTYI